MMLALRASSSRLPSALASASRIPIPVRPISTSPISRAKLPLQASKHAAEPMELLTLIGRNADKALAEQAKSWESLTELWYKGSEEFKRIGGLTPRERRFVAYCFNRYSKNEDPKDFIQIRKPKKFRGWGPAFQKGVRVRGLGMKPVA